MFKARPAVVLTSAVCGEQGNGPTLAGTSGEGGYTQPPVEEAEAQRGKYLTRGHAGFLDSELRLFLSWLGSAGRGDQDGPHVGCVPGPGALSCPRKSLSRTFLADSFSPPPPPPSPPAASQELLFRVVTC